jgi:hypothetical protein
MGIARSEIVGAWVRQNGKVHFHLRKSLESTPDKGLSLGTLEFAPICNTGGGDLQNYSELVESQDDNTSANCQLCLAAITALQQG